jgi:hypothetical protein
MPTSAIEYVQAAQEQTLKTVRQGQQAVVEAVASWAETVDKGAADQLPTPQELVQANFAFVERLLASQREFAEGVLAAAAPAFAKRAGS